MINVERITTIPSEIQRSVAKYINTLPAEVLSEIKSRNVNHDNDVRCAVERYMTAYKAPGLYGEISSCLQQHSIQCFHATRVLNKRDILNCGLIANDWNRYSMLLKATLETLGVPEDEITKALQCVWHEYRSKFLEPRPQICFFTPMNLICSEDVASYDQFCQNIGGELARRPLSVEMPEVYQVFKQAGYPIVVEFDLPFSDIADYDIDRIIYCFVTYYAGIAIWGKEYPIEFDGSTKGDVAPSRILKIHDYCREVDYE